MTAGSSGVCFYGKIVFLAPPREVLLKDMLEKAYCPEMNFDISSARYFCGSECPQRRILDLFDLVLSVAFY